MWYLSKNFMIYHANNNMILMQYCNQNNESPTYNYYKKLVLFSYYCLGYKHSFLYNVSNMDFFSFFFRSFLLFPILWIKSIHLGLQITEHIFIFFDVFFWSKLLFIYSASLVIVFFIIDYMNHKTFVFQNFLFYIIIDNNFRFFFSYYYILFLNNSNNFWFLIANNHLLFQNS